MYSTAHPPHTKNKPKPKPNQPIKTLASDLSSSKETHPSLGRGGGGGYLGPGVALLSFNPSSMEAWPSSLNFYVCFLVCKVYIIYIFHKVVVLNELTAIQCLEEWSVCSRCLLNVSYGPLSWKHLPLLLPVWNCPHLISPRWKFLSLLKPFLTFLFSWNSHSILTIALI